MSNYHVNHERLKRNRAATAELATADIALNGLNGTTTSRFKIHHRLQVVDGRVRSPISSKFVDVNTIMNAHPELFVYVITRSNTGCGIEHVLMPAIEADAFHLSNWHQLIENLAPVKG